MKKKIKKILQVLGLLNFTKYLLSFRNKTIWHLIFKSQKKQDRWVIFKVLPFKKNGFFVDLAAADGITHSNTWAMEFFFNWKGICIEPNPYFFNKLKQNRQCILDDSVVNNKRELIKFRIDNGQLGGIVADDTDNNTQHRGEELLTAKFIEKRSKSLTDILDFHNAPLVIDYFSLDVEGSEERVVKGINFKKYIFKCITVERPTENVNNILFDNGYIFVKNYKYDSFYIHHSIKENVKIPFEEFSQVPQKNW